MYLYFMWLSKFILIDRNNKAEFELSRLKKTDRCLLLSLSVLHANFYVALLNLQLGRYADQDGKKLNPAKFQDLQVFNLQRKRMLTKKVELFICQGWRLLRKSTYNFKTYFTVTKNLYSNFEFYCSLYIVCNIFLIF
jgi:hypothetical protein